MKPQNDNILISFLKCLKVKHTYRFSNKYYSEHPHKNNLYGLSKMLSEYRVEHKCLRFANKEKIPDNVCPFIAHMGDEFVVVTHVKKDRVDFIWKGKLISTNHTEFCRKWAGVTLLAETNEKSIEPDYKQNRISELFASTQTYMLFFLICVLIGALFVKQGLSSNIGLSTLITINLSGVFVGFLLVRKQIYTKSGYIDKICSLFKIGDCNDVLESKAAKFLGLVGWSEIGFAYFISNILLILLYPDYISYLALINVLALPYSIWSVWYQKFIAKQWCTMCLIVQSLLWSIFFMDLIFGYISIPFFFFEDVLIISILYLLPFLLISIVIPKFTESDKIENLSYEISSIKADEDVFITLFEKQEHHDVDLSISKIVWGNPNANFLITILTNPHCAPCGNMHNRMENFLKNNHDKVCVQYIFSYFNESLSDSNRFLISAYLNSTYEESGIIYNEWFKYGKHHREDFYRKYNFPFDAETEEEYTKHNAWIEKNKVMATPTILLNGYYLPDKYKIEDLDYLLDDTLLEAMGNRKNYLSP